VKWGALACVAALACSGCLAREVGSATQSVIATLDTSKAKAELADAGKTMGASVGDGLKASLLSQDTRSGLAQLRDALLADPKFKQEVASLQGVLLAGLDKRAAAIVDAAFARLKAQLSDPETLAALVALVDAVREHAVGAPLRADVAQAEDDLDARVAKAVAAARVNADAEIAKYRVGIIGIGAAALLLLALHVRREIVEWRREG